jgi:hypothetical protein
MNLIVEKNRKNRALKIHWVREHHLFFAEDPDRLIGEIQEFLTGVREPAVAPQSAHLLRQQN